MSTNGRVRNARTGKERKGHPDPRGYMSFSLYTGTKYVTLLVHRIMALAFLGPQPAGRPLVRHLDSDPTNNVIENLAWGTKSENAKDAVALGRWSGVSKTHCPQGHEYSSGNTFSSPSNPGRRCRECRREYDRATYWKRRTT